MGCSALCLAFPSVKMGRTWSRLLLVISLLPSPPPHLSAAQVWHVDQRRLAGSLVWTSYWLPWELVLSALLTVPVSIMPFIAVHSPAASPSWVFLPAPASWSTRCPFSSGVSPGPCPHPTRSLLITRYWLPLTSSTLPGSRLLEGRACPAPFISWLLAEGRPWLCLDERGTHGEQTDDPLLTASDFTPRTTPVLGVWDWPRPWVVSVSPLPSTPGKCLELVHSLTSLWIMWLFWKGTLPFSLSRSFNASTSECEERALLEKEC